MSHKFGSVNLTRWQLALLIGTPIVIGVGLFCIKKSKGAGKKSKTDTRKKNLTDASEKKPLCIHGTNEDKELEQKKKSAELENEELSPLKEATAFKTEGNNCYRKGKFDEAITFYDKAIAKCPTENRTDMAIFYQNRAAAYEMLKKWSSVKSDCTLSLDYNPRYAKAYFRRAKANEATYHLRECLDDITATCILENFKNNNTILYADRILRQTGKEDAENGMKTRIPVLPSNSFVSTYLRSFVYDPIQTFVLPTTVLNSTSNTRGFLRARIALDKEEYDNIITYCSDEIDGSESESLYKSEALLMRGTFHLLSGNFVDAQQDLDVLINNENVDLMIRVYALIRRASMFIQMEDKERGLSDFNSAQKLKPNNPDIYHQRAQIYMLLDQLPDAVAEFVKALRYAPHHGMALVQKCYAEYRLSLITQDQNRLGAIINEFKKLENDLEKYPDCIECYSLIAQVLADKKQFVQADQFYEKALKMAPKYASLYVHRGILYLQWKGDVDQAIKFMNHAIEIDGKCELAFETLGTIEVQRGNLTKAVELFNSAIKLAKTNSEMIHLYSLRNAAVAQINVTTKLGIDMSTIFALAQSGIAPPTHVVAAN